MEMLDSLLSLGLGAVIRLAPEVLDFFDRKSRRAHEQKMAESGIRKEEVSSAGVALAEAIKGQSILTGVKWADALNILVRPVITYWWVIILYTTFLVSSFIVLVNSGTVAPEAVLSIFGEDEKRIVSTIITFWFVDRVLRYKEK